MIRNNIPSHFEYWDELLHELANNPFLGTPRSHLARWRTHFGPGSGVLTGHAEGPQPAGPFPNPTVDYLTMLVSMQEVAETMDEQGGRRGVCGQYRVVDGTIYRRLLRHTLAFAGRSAVGCPARG